MELGFTSMIFNVRLIMMERLPLALFDIDKDINLMSLESGETEEGMAH